MILQPLTLSVLENYKEISSKIVFNKNNEGFLTLSNEGRSIVTYFELSEDEKKIPEHGIYDLTSLMSIIGVMKNNDGFDLKFEEKFLVIKTKVSQVKYYYSPIDLLPEPPQRKIIDAEPTFSFLLKNADIEKLKTMSKHLSIDTVQIEVKEKNAMGIIRNTENETSNTFKLILGKCEFPDHPPVTWNLSNWKFMKGVDYKISVMSVKNQNLSKFEAVDGDGKSLKLLYYIATNFD